MAEKKKMTVKQKLGTVNPETQRKRLAASKAKLGRRKAGPGEPDEGGGKTSTAEAARRRARNPAKITPRSRPASLTSRGGQEMPTASYGRNPRAASKEMPTAKPASKSAMAKAYGKKTPSSRFSGVNRPKNLDLGKGKEKHKKHLQ